MDQAGLTFGPELLLVRTGYPVEFRNSDDTLHNVRVSHEETRDVGVQRRDSRPASRTPTRSSATASIGSAATSIRRWRRRCSPPSSPFTTLAGTDGSFAFADVPAGRVDRHRVHRRQAAAQGRRGHRRRDERHDRVAERRRLAAARVIAGASAAASSPSAFTNAIPVVSQPVGAAARSARAATSSVGCRA